MSTLRRSTTGCAACKAMRKKCDETKPQCLRCQGAGRSCSYEYVEDPGNEGYRVKRTKPAPRGTSDIFVNESQNVPALDAIGSSFVPLIPRESIVLARSTLLQACNSNTDPNPSLVIPEGPLSLLPISPASSKSLPYIDPIGSSITSLEPSSVPCANNLVLTTPGWTSRTLVWTDSEGDEDDNDPEEVGHLLCRAPPTLDKNVKQNTLPFVLHCYSQWALASVFEPLKIVHTMRDQVISQFSSRNSRRRTILIANVMDMFAKSFSLDGARQSILNHLILDARESGAAFMASSPSFVPALDRQNATRTLDNMLEILGLQLDTQPTAESMQSLSYAAPVFRRACSEPPGQPINLPNILMGPNLNLRYFATVEILMSVLTGQSTHFRYEVPLSPDFWEQMYHWQLQGNYGLHWLYGIPDQFIMLFAWINAWSEAPGANDNVELINWIEMQISQIKVAIDESGDAALRLGRMVVHECWRFAVLIYLYMACVLCKANAHDPRVIRAQKGFMRLVRGVKPGRYPDVHLVTPMLVAGVAMTKERDRSTLRQRILNVGECIDQGTGGNDIITNLEDIWARTRDEGRPAVWSDLGIAYSKLTGR